MSLCLLAMAGTLAGCGDGSNAQSSKTEEEPLALTWDVLSGYEYTTRMKFPDQVSSLSGKRATVRGYIYPTSQSRGIGEFILMKDQGTCCYGPQTQYTHFMWVRIVKGPRVNYTRDPLEVTGTFRLNERIDGDYVEGIYELDADHVRRIE
jgi:hypothetical protein